MLFFPFTNKSITTIWCISLGLITFTFTFIFSSSIRLSSSTKPKTVSTSSLYWNYSVSHIHHLLIIFINIVTIITLILRLIVGLRNCFSFMIEFILRLSVFYLIKLLRNYFNFKKKLTGGWVDSRMDFVPWKGISSISKIGYVRSLATILGCDWMHMGSMSSIW